MIRTDAITSGGLLLAPDLRPEALFTTTWIQHTVQGQEKSSHREYEELPESDRRTFF